jgi:uncharacterized protein (DUF1499 family)
MKWIFHEKRPLSKAALTSLLLALLAVAAAIGAGLGSRWNWWPFGQGFKLLQWGVYMAIAAALLSLWGLIASRRAGGKRGRLSALLGLLVSVPVIVIPLLWINKARTVPPIHDITTDTVNPPQFQAVLPLRKEAPNSAQYEGAPVAAQQRKAYPNVQPIITKATPSAAFAAAAQTARELGWNIVAQDPTQGRIEATDTTFWFGFTDDIVIRIKPLDGGSRLDIRSESRVGRSDVGTNAARIAKFSQAYSEHLGVNR